MYIDYNLENQLRGLAKADNLTEEQKKTVEKLMALIDNEVYRASYNKDDITVPAVSYAQNLMGCTQSEDVIEEKILGYDEFFDAVAEDLGDYENFPTSSDVGETVEKLMPDYFEVDSYGKLLYRGLADN